MPRIRSYKDREGFTLIELMIVVAIIGVLAAIAIPNFIRFQLRSRAGEGKVNISGLRTSEEAFFSEFQRYIAVAAVPNAAGAPGDAVTCPGQGGSCKQPWDGTSTNANGLAGVQCPNPLPANPPGHCIIGWLPDGPTYYNYVVDIPAAGPFDSFYAQSESDIDADGTLNILGFAKQNLNGQMNANADTFGCAAANAGGLPLDMSTGPNGTARFDFNGPCAATFTQSVF